MSFAGGRVVKHRVRMPLPVPGMDRTSDVWVRLRAAVGDVHPSYVDADAHVDRVVRTLSLSLSCSSTGGTSRGSA